MKTARSAAYLQSENWLLASLLVWASTSFISNSLLSLHHVLAVVAFMFFVAEKPWANSKLRIEESQWFLLGLAAALAVSVFVNWSTLEKPLRNLGKIKYVVIAVLLAVQVGWHREKIKKHFGSILMCFILSYSVANVWGLIKMGQHHFTQPELEFRLSGFFGMVMSYAYAAVLPLGLIFYLLLHSKLRIKLQAYSSDFLQRFYARRILLALFFLALIALYFTLTRGALIGALLVLPALLFSRSRKLAYICAGISMVIVLVGAALAFSNQEINSRIFLKANHRGNSERLAQNKMGLKAFQENPFFGIGFRSFEQKGTAIKEKNGYGYLEMQSHAHNNFLEILGTSGLLGFVFFFLWIAFWIRESLLQKEWRAYSLTVIAAFLVMGLFQSTFIDSEYVFTLLALYGLGPAFRYWG